MLTYMVPSHVKHKLYAEHAQLLRASLLLLVLLPPVQAPRTHLQPGHVQHEQPKHCCSG